MNQNKKTIFISYGRDTKNPQDVKLVYKVKQDLKREGFEVLMDEEQLRATQDWEIKLENMINDSDWILFFITPYSARRPDGYCLNELAMSLNYKKPIAPIMVHYEIPPLSICRLQYLDLQELKDDGSYQKKLNEIIAVINEESRLGFEGEHLRVLTELNPLKFDYVMAKYIYGFVGREWVYDKVNRWMEGEEESRVLWMMAEAGFGKSAIATYLARVHPSALSVYFCQYDLSESKETREMLKVLIYQLSTQIDEYHKILQTLNIKEALQKSAGYIFSQLLLEPLQQIGKQEEKHFFIIDALDEADKNGQNEIVKFIADRFLDLPSWLNIIITSRPEPELLRKLKKFNPVELRADDERNIRDMKLFLSKSEKVLPEKILRRPEIKEKIKQALSEEIIVQALIEKSKGNILYLKSILELDMIKDEELTLETIKQLPNSREGFYLAYFERRFDDIGLYKEKYSEFVDLLVAEEGLPELLLRDILGMREREYKRIKSSFGSLLEVEDGNLIFYHKSIYEWLSDYDKSGDYAADVELGRENLDVFMDGLIAESYKEKYLEFGFFNRKLVDRVYEQDGNLERFFGILELVDNEKKIDGLETLAMHYYLYNRMYRAVKLQERLFRITKSLYRNNPDRWAEKYTKSLLNLAINYGLSNRVSEAIELQEQNFSISEKYYLDNPDHWAESYTYSLSNLANSYTNSNRIPEAIELTERSLGISEKYYRENPDHWVKNYIYSLSSLANSYSSSNRISEAIALEEQSLGISEKLYQDNPDLWAEGYIDKLNNLAFYYGSNNRTLEAIELEERSLGILEKLCQSNPDRWAEKYIRSLYGLSNSYRSSNRISEAIESEEQSLSLSRKLYRDNPNRWAELYTDSLSSRAYFYSNSNRIPEAIELEEQSLGILKKLYQDNPDRWAELYTNSLNNLALYYNNSNRIPEAIELREKCLKIRKILYQDNPDYWAKGYSSLLNNLAFSYYSNNHILEAIELGEQNLNILEKLYRDNPDCWAEHYTRLLSNLAIYYSNSNRLPKSIKLTEQSLGILEKLYQDNPDYWAELYTNSLNNLALYYSNSNRIPEAIELQEENLGILEKLYQNNPDRWAEGYTRLLSNLAISYSNSNRLPESIKLTEQSLGISEKLYQDNPDRWAELYTNSLGNLALYYSSNNQIPESIELTEQGLGILEKLYRDNPDRWAETYIRTLDNLSIVNFDLKHIDSAIEMSEKCYIIGRERYNMEPKKWKTIYMETMKNLEMYYREAGENKKERELRRKRVQEIILYKQ